MSRQFDYRAPSELPAATVFAAMTDADCIRARLTTLGGPGAALLEHTADAEAARFRVRHGLNTDDVPPAIRPFLPGNLVIDRLETWRRADEGRYEGTAQVAVPGTPASATAVMRLADGVGGSTLEVRSDVTVAVPLFGGRIEETVGAQINQLLAAETAFTLDWAKNRS